MDLIELELLDRIAFKAKRAGVDATFLASALVTGAVQLMNNNVRQRPDYASREILFNYAKLLSDSNKHLFPELQIELADDHLAAAAKFDKHGLLSFLSGIEPITKYHIRAASDAINYMSSLSQNNIDVASLIYEQCSDELSEVKKLLENQGINWGN